MTIFSDRTSAEGRRQESETGFTPILAQLVSDSPGAIGAALVDAEGEAVDYVGDRVDPFAIKLAAAHWRIVLQDAERSLRRRAGRTLRLAVRTSSLSFLIEALPDGYALMSVLQGEPAFAHSQRATDAALSALYREARWPAPPEWSPSPPTSDHPEPETSADGHRVGGYDHRSEESASARATVVDPAGPSPPSPHPAAIDSRHAPRDPVAREARWYEVEVKVDPATGKPVAARFGGTRGTWGMIEVFGKVATELAGGAFGYRARLDRGVEEPPFDLTIVCGRDGRWWADTPWTPE